MILLPAHMAPVPSGKKGRGPWLLHVGENAIEHALLPPGAAGGNVPRVPAAIANDIKVRASLSTVLRHPKPQAMPYAVLVEELDGGVPEFALGA